MGKEPTDSQQGGAQLTKPVKSPPMSTATRGAIYSLYVVKCLPPREIAAKLGINDKTLRQYVLRHGLTQERDSKIKQAELRAANKALTQSERFFEHVANESEELTHDVLAATREELKGNSDFKAKNIASYSAAAKNFFAMHKDARGIGSTGGTSIGVANFFVSALPEAQRPERNVTPKANETAVDSEQVS